MSKQKKVKAKVLKIKSNVINQKVEEDDSKDAEFLKLLSKWHKNSRNRDFFIGEKEQLV